jgi:hypothetical protein
MVLILSLFACYPVFAQCVPDPACVDTGMAGELCPMELADGTVNVPYEEVLTIIPPGEFTLGEYTIIIDHIIIDSVTNLPGGITYETNADIMYADTSYCVLISGTPTTAGEYTLAITVTPWVDAGGTVIPSEQVTNDTSIVMTIHEASGIDPARYDAFQVLPNIPNPFSEITRIGFYTPRDAWIELMVYNILGERLYWERAGAPPGEHYFDFDGQALQPGTYFYRVTNQEEIITGKFIKARR